MANLNTTSAAIRELSVNEMDNVNGGNPAIAIAVAVIAVVVVYEVYQYLKATK